MENTNKDLLDKLSDVLDYVENWTSDIVSSHDQVYNESSMKALDQNVDKFLRLVADLEDKYPRFYPDHIKLAVENAKYVYLKVADNVLHQTLEDDIDQLRQLTAAKRELFVSDLEREIETYADVVQDGVDLEQLFGTSQMMKKFVEPEIKKLDKVQGDLRKSMITNTQNFIKVSVSVMQSRTKAHFDQTERIVKELLNSADKDIKAAASEFDVKKDDDPENDKVTDWKADYKSLVTEYKSMTKMLFNQLNEFEKALIDENVMKAIYQEIKDLFTETKNIQKGTVEDVIMAKNFLNEALGM